MVWRVMLCARFETQRVGYFSELSTIPGQCTQGQVWHAEGQAWLAHLRVSFSSARLSVARDSWVVSVNSIPIPPARPGGT